VSKEEVYQNLKRRLVSEKLRPGDWLVERELGDRYGLSRTPIREILRRLANEGLVEMLPGKGYMVKRLSAAEIAAIFQAREAIEGEAARLACASTEVGFWRELHDIRSELERTNATADPAAGVTLGWRLHQAIVQAAGNFLLEEFYHKLQNYAALTRNITRKSAEIEAASRTEHLEILRAMERRGGEEAERTMRAHLRNTSRRLLSSFFGD
jgi:DNA-binding GntR family transcriptional regulator